MNDYGGGAALWVRSSTLSGFAADAQITSWENEGSGPDLEAFGNATIRRVALAEFNGLDAADFASGGAAGFEAALGLTAGQARTVMSVLKYTHPTIGAGCVSVFSGSSGLAWPQQYYNLTGTYYITGDNINGGAVNGTVAQAPTLDTVQLLTWISPAAGGSVRFRINGVEEAVTNGTRVTEAGTTFRLGGNNDAVPSQPFIGMIATHVVWNSALSQVDYEAAEAALMLEYNL